MKIRITQYQGPDREFDSYPEYETFLRTTSDELVHLEEFIDGVQITEENAPTELNELWERVFE